MLDINMGKCVIINIYNDKKYNFGKWKMKGIKILSLSAALALAVLLGVGLSACDDDGSFKLEGDASKSFIVTETGLDEDGYDYAYEVFYVYLTASAYGDGAQFALCLYANDRTDMNGENWNDNAVEHINITLYNSSDIGETGVKEGAVPYTEKRFVYGKSSYYARISTADRTYSEKENPDDFMSFAYMMPKKNGQSTDDVGLINPFEGYDSIRQWIKSASR